MTALPNNGAVCQTCRFCEHQPPARYCRIRAARSDRTSLMVAGWPPVEPLEWCGEHQWSDLHHPDRQRALAWHRLLGFGFPPPETPATSKGGA